MPNDDATVRVALSDDLLLLFLLRRDEGAPLYILLDLGGSVVTGRLISEREWFQSFQATYAATVTPTNTEPVTKVLADVGPLLDQKAALVKQANHVPPFLHLANVRSMGNSAMPTGTALRVRTDQVRAWALLSPDAEPVQQPPQSPVE